MGQSGTAGTSFPDSKRTQGLMAFRDILDIVLNLHDEEWMTLTKDMTLQYTKLNIASLCTKIVISVSASVIGKMLPDLIESFGIESVLCAEAKLKKKVECELRSRSATLRSSGQRLPEDFSDLVCDSVETAFTKIKAAMQEAIRRVASGQKSKTVADELNKSLTNLSPDSDVKPETDDSVPLQNKATQAVSDMLVKKFSHILTQTGLDPNVVTSSDAKDIVETVVNGLVSAAEENDDHPCPSGTLISSKKPCSGLQDAAAAAVPDAQKEPSKLLADVDSCTEEVMCQLDKSYLCEEEQAKSSFYKKPQSKDKMYMVLNAEMTFKESIFFTSRTDVFLDEAALAVRNILLKKSVPDLLDKPITTLYDSGPFRSQFALKRGASDSGGSVVMILDQFYETMQSIAGDATNSSDALAGFAGDAVDIGKEQSLNPRTILKKVRNHLQEFLLKFSSEEIEEKEDELVIDLCTEEVINEAVHLYRNGLIGSTSFMDINILTSAQFQTRLSHRVSEIILQKLESCPSLMPKKSFSESHLRDISSEISRSVSSTLQQFASSQLALRSGSSSQTSATPLVRAPKDSGHSSLFSPLCLFIEVQNKLKIFFSLFIESPEKPYFSAESEKDEEYDDDLVIPIYITNDGHVLEITEENELSFKRENLAPQDMIREQAHVLTNLTAELFLKSKTAGSFCRKCSSDSLLETAGIEVNTINSIPCPSKLVYTFAEEAIKCLLHYVLKPNPERSHLAGYNEGASCSTSCSTPDRSAGHPSSESLRNLTISNHQNPPSCCSLRPISPGGSVDPAPVAVKKEERRRFHFILEKKAPQISSGCCKKFNNGCEVFLTLSEEPTISTKEDFQKTSRGESNFRKSLARIFSSISRSCTSCVRDQSTL